MPVGKNFEPDQFRAIFETGLDSFPQLGKRLTPCWALAEMVKGSVPALVAITFDTLHDNRNLHGCTLINSLEKFTPPAACREWLRR